MFKLAGHMVSVPITQLSLCIMQSAVDQVSERV